MDSIPFEWTRAVLKWSLTATSSSSLPGLDPSSPTAISTTSDPIDDPGKDPQFRKLAEAVLFSRRFIWTYNAVLVLALLVFTVWHWGEKALLARRRREHLIREKSRLVAQTATQESRSGDEAWSSSSSTIEGTATPPNAGKKAVATDEETPLLPGRRAKSTSRFWRPYYILKSWLQYQPRPIPVLNKTLPPNSISLVVLAYVGLNIFYNFYRMPLSAPYLFVFADRCGLIFVANLPILYLFAAKNQPIKFLTGYSYESLNIFHRRIGEIVCFEAFLHFLGMMGVWYFLLRHIGFTLVHFLFNKLVGLGLGAFISYEILYFTSLGSFRQRWYELFLALHVFLQTAGLALLFFHHHTARPYVGISLGIFIIDRVVFRCWIKLSSHPATLTILDDDETVLLSANWNISKPSPFGSLSMNQGWKPNDHVFLTIPALSHSDTMRAHPFTIFSAAPETSEAIDQQHAWFSLLIRPQSGFTRDLLSFARQNTKTCIRLDGPYGSSHALDILTSSDNALIVAGGSGIAVAYPLLWALLHPSPPSDIERGVFKRGNTARTVRLLWIVHSPEHESWLPQDKLDELKDWGLLVEIPVTSVHGRPDVHESVRKVCEGQKTGIVVSGPDSLVRDVRNAAASSIRDGESIAVSVEKFGW